MATGPNRLRALVPVLGLAVALLLPGCSKDEASSAECRQVAAVEGTTSLTIVAKNLAFDVRCFEIEPGRVEVTFDNQDSSVAHNLHITGNGVNEKTDLEPGKTTQHLSVTLALPGRYTFACDPHGSMEGTIVVSELGAGSATTAA